MGIARKANTRGRGALERGHGTPLETLAQLGDALRSVGPLSILEAAQRVCVQAVSMTKEECQGSRGVDRKANSRPVRATGGLLQGLQRRVALEALRESSCSFGTELVVVETAGEGRSGNGERTAVSTGADRKTNTREPVRATGSVL